MASYTPKTAPDPKETGWPKGIKYIVGNEGCERFSYYGMKAILYAYMVTLFINLRGMDTKAAEDSATSAYHLFAVGVYAFPLIGAIIADRFLGKYKTILYLSVVYCLGHLALALFESEAIQLSIFGTVLLDPIQGLTLGLILIAVGSGGIKPCVSAHVGDQFGKGNWHLLPKVFNAFYFIINFGSFFANLIIPVIRGEEQIDAVTGVISYSGSVGLAFGIPGILMGIATFFFYYGRKEFVHIPPKPGGKIGLLDALSGICLLMAVAYPLFFNSFTSWPLTIVITIGFLAGFVMLFSARQRIEPDDGFLAILFFAFASLFKGQSKTTGFYGTAIERFGAEAVEGPKAVLRIIAVLFPVAVFWGLFDQHGSTWVKQAKAMDLVVFGVKLLPSQIQGTNPLLVMLLIPFVSFVLYPWMEKKGWKPTPLRRMAIGMFMAAAAFAVIAGIQMVIDTGATISVTWQLIGYTIMTLSEVMVSITGLEFAYSQAPTRMKSVIMGVWLFYIAVGNLLVSFVAEQFHLEAAPFFWLFTGLMLVASVVFVWGARKYTYRDYSQ